MANKRATSQGGVNDHFTICSHYRYCDYSNHYNHHNDCNHGDDCHEDGAEMPITITPTKAMRMPVMMTVVTMAKMTKKDKDDMRKPKTIPMTEVQRGVGIDPVAVLTKTGSV